MSGLLSTFIIEPVVRQARRFSSQGSQARPAAPPRPRPLPLSPPPTTATAATAHQSHANANAIVDADAAQKDAHQNLSPHPSEQIDDEDDNAIADEQLATFDHFVPALATAAAATVANAHTSDPALLQGDSLTHRQTISEDLAPASIALNSLEISPHAGHDAPLTGDNLQPHTPDSHDIPTAVVGDPDMAPLLPAQTRGARTSSARDIPRPQMSLREDSPSQAARSLPADDGMRLLRERIHRIRELQAPQNEKARRMLDLMTEEWHAAQIALRPQSPASMVSQERTFMPSSPLSTITTPTSPDSVASIPIPISKPPVDPANPFNINPEDLQPSYRPLPDSDQPPADESHDDQSPTSDPLEPVLGCKHYKRNVKIQCHDCREWHSCRHCHDATVTTHHLNRKATENMLCMRCWTPQAAGQYCKECGEMAAWYYCDICKLWDDDGSKSIYHCPDCGICRRGEGLGKDFVHCKKCNVCISIAHYATHTCIENATDSNCPLCLDYMFTSPLEIVAMPCGHYLHHHCYTSLMLSTYQCPICKRSAVNMETQWRKLEEEIRHQPMPIEWGDVKVEVKCNDCGGLTVGGFHWLGVKCGRCDGFNTQTVRMMAENEDVRRDLQDFAERRRERRAENGRETFRRTATAPVTVRPYFLGDDSNEDSQAPGGRPRSARYGDNVFTFPELPRLPEFSGRLPNLAEYRARLPSGLPNMPNMPSMPGFNFPFDLGVLDRVGRGLSPIRHYFDDQIADGVPRQFRMEGVRGSTEAEAEEESGWRDEEGWIVDGESSGDDEEEDTEGEDEDSDEDMEDLEGLDNEDDDDDDEEGGGERMTIELTGHR